MTESEYRAHPAISVSDLKNLKISYNYFLEQKKQKEPTSSMKFGTAFHTLFLEPLKFTDQYRVTSADKRTKAYKELAEANPNATFITEEEFDKLTTMAYSAREKYKQLFGSYGDPSQPLQIETPIFNHIIPEVLSKGKPDLILQKERIIIDLKTTQSAHPDEFARSIANYSYGLQAAYYLALTGMDRFLFLATETQAPYQSCFFELKKEDLNIYLNEAIRLLKSYVAYTTNQITTHDYGVLKTITLPTYHLSKIIEENINHEL